MFWVVTKDDEDVIGDDRYIRAGKSKDARWHRDLLVAEGVFKD
jgi:hypothetical protein